MLLVWLLVVAVAALSRKTADNVNWVPVRISETDGSTRVVLEASTAHHWRFELDGVSGRGRVYEESNNKTFIPGWARLVLEGEMVAGSFEGADAIWHLGLHNSQLAVRSEPQQLKYARAFQEGCTSLPQAALLDIVVDSAYTAAFPSTDAARIYTLGVVGQASQLWESTYNISLAVRTLEFGNGSQPWDTCQTTATTPKFDGTTSEQGSSLRSRLEALTSWRSSDTDVAAWVLFTGCSSSDVIGIAWQGAACKADAAIVLRHTALDYRVLSHELGHTFGAVHDCDNVTCTSPNSNCCPLNDDICDAQGRYIMNPESTPDQTMFSKCSQFRICGSIKSGNTNTTCLVPQQQTSDCARAMNNVAAIPCNSSNPCMLACTQPGGVCKLTNITLEDGVPCPLSSRICGLCSKGKCVHRRTWVWIMALVVSVLGVVAITVGAILYIKKRKIPPIGSKDISKPIATTNSVYPITQ